MHAIFHMHQASGTCAGMCMRDWTHRMEKTDHHFLLFCVKMLKLTCYDGFNYFKFFFPNINWIMNEKYFQFL